MSRCGFRTEHREHVFTCALGLYTDLSQPCQVARVGHFPQAESLQRAQAPLHTRCPECTAGAAAPRRGAPGEADFWAFHHAQEQQGLVSAE